MLILLFITVQFIKITTIFLISHTHTRTLQSDITLKQIVIGIMPSNSNDYKTSMALPTFQPTTSRDANDQNGGAFSLIDMIQIHLQGFPQRKVGTHSPSHRSPVTAQSIGLIIESALQAIDLSIDCDNESCRSPYRCIHPPPPCASRNVGHVNDKSLCINPQ